MTEGVVGLATHGREDVGCCCCWKGEDWEEKGEVDGKGGGWRETERVGGERAGFEGGKRSSRADGVSDLAEAREVNGARVGGAAGHDERRLVLRGQPLDLLVVDEPRVLLG